MIDRAELDVGEADDWIAKTQPADAGLANELQSAVLALKSKLSKLQTQADNIE
jgi:hypothetical protein